jgi:arylsulfate sulfotransferase
MRLFQARIFTNLIIGILCLLLTSFTAHAVEIISGPTLTMNPNGVTPLAGVVEIETDEPVRILITITDGIDSWTAASPYKLQQHYLPVLGLKVDRSYTIDVEIRPGGLVGTLIATTDRLPADFPTFVTVVSDPQAMEPGYTLVDCFNRSRDDTRETYTVIVDSAGEIVWYTTLCFSAALQLPNGKIFHRSDDFVVETDMLGINTYLVEFDTPGTGLHHDLQQTPHGTYISLSRQSVDVDDFPTSQTDPDAPTAPTTLWDDSVVEFLPDGTLRREWPLIEMLDPTRIGYDSLNARPQGLDWTHSNAVNYKPADDSIIVSVRHQDAVIKFSRETGDLEWILGPHDNWGTEFQQYLLTPISTPFEWQFHQHAPMWTESGNLVLFDNGNWRASPFDGNTPDSQDQSWSRGVEFEIDSDNMEVRQVWEYGKDVPERLFSFFISDADYQETTGNRLMNYGGVSHVDGVPSIDLNMGVSHARIIETTNDIVPVKVFEMWFYDPDGGQIRPFRSERIPSLYPQEYIESPNGVGDTLRMNKISGQPEISWTVSPVDSEHDAANYYMVYHSSLAPNGFSMLDSTAHTDIKVGGTEQLVFYKLAAANVAGTSGDEPAP